MCRWKIRHKLSKRLCFVIGIVFCCGYIRLNKHTPSSVQLRLPIDADLPNISFDTSSHSNFAIFSTGYDATNDTPEDHVYNLTGAKSIDNNITAVLTNQSDSSLHDALTGRNSSHHVIIIGNSTSSPNHTADLSKRCKQLLKLSRLNYEIKPNYFQGYANSSSRVCLATQLTFQRFVRLTRLAEQWAGIKVRFSLHGDKYTTPKRWLFSRRFSSLQWRYVGFLSKRWRILLTSDTKLASIDRVIMSRPRCVTVRSTRVP